MPPSAAKESHTTIEDKVPTQQNDDEVHQETATTAHTDRTKEQVSNRDELRKMWKETRMERREIEQMKSRGHEMRKNLEQKLKSIRDLVRRPRLQKEDIEPSQTTSMESKEGDRSHHQASDRKLLADRYRELDVLRAQLLGELEKLSKSKPRRFRTTDRGMQTGPDPRTEVQLQGGTIEEQEARAGEDSQGLLGHLQNYCFRCCGHCYCSSPDEG
ncbi:unnamed protein product [Merluccius merluccius]